MKSIFWLPTLAQQMVKLTYITHLFQLILLNWNTIRFQEFTSSECIYQGIGADLSTTQYQRYRKEIFRLPYFSLLEKFTIKRMW